MNAAALAQLMQEVQRLADAVRDARAEHLAERGVGAFDRRLLGLLESAGRPVTTHRLARRLLCPVSDVNERLRSLRERGWVAEAPMQRGHRATVELCPVGRRELEALRRAERQSEAVLDAAFDESTVRAATALLRAARGRLQGGRQRRGRARRRAVVVSAEPDRPRRALATGAGSAGGVVA